MFTEFATQLMLLIRPVCFGWAADLFAGHFVSTDEARGIGVLVGLGMLFGQAAIINLGNFVAQGISRLAKAMEQRHNEAEAIVMEQRHEELLEKVEAITSRLDGILDELREPSKRRSEP